MSSPTPGPWIYFDSYDGEGEYPIGACPHCGRTDMAYFHIPGGHGDGECAMYTKADARLIVAAPDLLAAAQLAYDFSEMNTLDFVAKYGYGISARMKNDRLLFAIKAAEVPHE